MENSAWVQTPHKRDPVYLTINFTIPISSAFCPHEEHANPFYVSVEVMTEEKEYLTGDRPISMADVGESTQKPIKYFLLFYLGNVLFIVPLWYYCPTYGAILWPVLTDLQSHSERAADGCYL